MSKEWHSPNVEVFGETGAPSTAEETEGHGGGPRSAVGGSIGLKNATVRKSVQELKRKRD